MLACTYLTPKTRIAYANNTLWTDQLDETIGDSSLTIALSIGFEVSKIADMTSLVSWSTVCFAKWVDYSFVISLVLAHCVSSIRISGLQ